jgi:CHAT domain-containing protein
MKLQHFRKLSFVFCLWFMTWCLPLFSQQTEKNLTQNLHYLRHINSFSHYYSTLDSLGKYWEKKKNTDPLYDLKKYYQRLPQNQDDSVTYRKYLIKYAQKFKNQGEYLAALPFYLQASSFSKDLKTDDKVWFCENRIGGIYARLDDYDKAIFYFKKCIPYLSAVKDNGTLSRLYKEIGRAYMWMGNIAEMKNYYENGIVFGQKSDEYKGLQAISEAYAEYHLDYDTSVTRLAKCKKYLDNSLYYLNKMKDEKDYGERAYNLDHLYGRYFHAKKDYGEAEQYYLKAIHQAEPYFDGEKSREIAKIYGNLAKTYLEERRLSLANESIKNGFCYLLSKYQYEELPNEQDIDLENTFVTILDLKSQYYYQNYLDSDLIPNLDSALLSLDLAMLANDQLKKLLILQNSGYVSVASNKQLVNTATGYCYLAYKNTGDLRYVEIARKFFDRSKSLMLRENQDKGILKEKMNKRDRAIFDSLENKLIRLYQKDFSGNDKIEEDILTTTESREKIYQKYITTSAKSSPVSGPYLEYITTDHETYLLTNIGPQPMYSLGRTDELIKKIDKVNQLLNIKNDQLLDGQLDTLFRMLVPVSIKGLPKIKIIPDGKITFVPFDILRNGDRYLMEDHVLSLVFHHQQPDYLDRWKWYYKTLVVQPQYPKSEIPQYASLERGSLSHLPFAGEEISKIREHFESLYSVKTSVDISSFRKWLKDHDIFHFAGHALVSGDSSYLAVTDDKGKIFTIPDQLLFNMSNELDLVTLSACETGLGTFKQGEGVRSLAVSFLNAGTRSIVYSLWEADDQSTSTIMALFYRYLQEGKNKDEALVEAKKTFLLSCSPDQRHPYYWAGFVIVGDTNALDNMISKNQLYGVLAVALLLVIYLFIYFKNKTK